MITAMLAGITQVIIFDTKWMDKLHCGLYANEILMLYIMYFMAVICPWLLDFAVELCCSYSFNEDTQLCAEYFDQPTTGSPHHSDLGSKEDQSVNQSVNL